MSQLSQSLEDYLEALYILAQSKQTVRVKDLVLRMGVRSPSVIGALNRLEALNLVRHEHHSHVALTEAGEEKAMHIYRRHRQLTALLRDVLGVSPVTAEEDACKIEHLISPETLKQIEAYLSRHVQTGNQGPQV
jgi:DtxR family Mn-dependent transcriptional regulator